MAIERFAFCNRRGQRLAACFHPSLSYDQSRAVITCHGMMSNKDGRKHQLLAQMLASSGICVLRFDFAGRGESDGRLFDMTYSGEMEDLCAAVDWLHGHGVQRIGVFGSSMGGAVALLWAARDERVVSIATLAAVAYPAELVAARPELVAQWNTHGFVESDQGRLGKTYYDDALLHDVVSAVRVIRAPLLVIHGEGDNVVPPMHAHDIAAAARNASLELVPGADHEFTKETHLRPTLGVVVDFFERTLAL